jgi:hypothetical protein
MDEKCKEDEAAGFEERRHRQGEEGDKEEEEAGSGEEEEVTHRKWRETGRKKNIQMELRRKTWEKRGKEGGSQKAERKSKLKLR